MVEPRYGDGARAAFRRKASGISREYGTCDVVVRSSDEVSLRDGLQCLPAIRRIERAGERIDMVQSCPCVGGEVASDGDEMRHILSACCDQRRYRTAAGVAYQHERVRAVALF